MNNCGQPLISIASRLRKSVAVPHFAIIAGWVLATSVVLPCAARALEITPGYAEVQQAFLREDFLASAQLARRFLTEHPEAEEFSRVSIWLAVSLDRLQRAPEALSVLDRLKQQLAAKDPRWLEVLFWDGDISRRAVQLVRARQAFQRLLLRDANSTWAPQARLGLGLIYLNQQAYAAAAEAFEDVVARYPGTPAAQDGQLFQGLCLVQLDRHEEASNVLRELVMQTKDPAVAAQAGVYYGEALTALGRFSESLAAYRRAREAAQQSSWGDLALFGLGWAQYRLGQCQDSVDSFTRYLALRRPEHKTEALFAQAGCLVQLNRYPEALARYEQVVASDPRHALAFDSQLAIIDAHQTAGRDGAAKDAVHRLLRETQDAGKRAQLQVRLGNIALSMGNAPQAQTVYKLALEGASGATRQAALNGLGDVNLFQGQPQAAEAFFKQALEGGSGSQAEYARYQLGRIQLQLGRHAQAAEVFQQLIGDGHTSLADDARLALALTYLNQGEPQLARAQLNAIRSNRQRTTSSARAAYYLALVALEQNDESMARKYCQEAIDGAPRSDESVDARLLLADLLSRQTSVADAMEWLRLAYQTAQLPRRHRAKLAKRLADYARQEGAYAQALRWYDDAEQLMPALRGEIAYRVASCYEEAGDIGTAIARYRSIKQPPWRVRGQLALAKLLERDGKIQEAERVYEGAARESSPEAHSAQDRLAALRGASQE